jgi:predicted branched-subunit amino acid permease
VGAAIAPLGIALGAAMGETDVSPVVAALTAPLMVAGASQLALVSQLDQGATALAAALAAVLINLRFVVYGAAMSSRFAGQPRWFRLLGPHSVVDQSYGMVTARAADGDLPDGDARAFRRYFATAGGLLTAVWTVSVGIGIVAGSLLPEGIPLDLVLPAMFVGIVVPQLKGRRDLALAAVAAAIACAPVPTNVVLVSCAVVGGIIGAHGHREAT